MPATIKPSRLKYKDPTTGNYVPVDAIGAGNDIIVPIFSPSTTQQGEFVCNMTFSEVLEAALAKKCGYCVYGTGSQGRGFILQTATSYNIVFVQDVCEGGSNTITRITYANNGTITLDYEYVDISGQLAKRYGTDTNLFPVAIGDLCIKDGKLYKANTAISTFETFNPNKWDPIKIDSELSLLNGALSGKIDEPSSEGTSGQFLQTDGNGGRTWATPSGGSGGVSDVQVNGTSVVTQGVANIPLGSASDFGALKVGDGLAVTSGVIKTNGASANDAKSGSSYYKPVVPVNQHATVFYGLAKAAGDTTQKDSSNSIGVYTENAISKIHDMIDAPVSVSGSTPTINAKAGVRYICGEVSTLTIVVPASGIIDVTFESGSTPTVLTVTPPTGVTMKWANGFDSTNLDANTVYEINIADGCLGVCGKWT